MNIYGDFSRNKLMQILQIQEQIQACRNWNQLQLLVTNYNNADNPDTFYHLGVGCILFDKYDEAKRLLIKGAKFGLKFPNEYFNTIFSDAIGQCFYNLVCNLDSQDYDTFVLAYVYLSNCAQLMPRQAFDSLRSRALLMKHQDSFTMSFLFTYLGMGNLKEPLIISDLYFAGLGFKDNPKIQQECFDDAKKLHIWLEDISVAGKDANDYSIQEMAILGEQRHKRLFDSLLPEFKVNKFDPEF